MHEKTSDILYGILSWVVGAGMFYLGLEVYFELRNSWSDFAELGNSLLAATISLMIASRVGMAIYCKDINGGASSVGNINYFVWLVGLSIYIALTFLTDMAFSRHLLHIKYSHNLVFLLIETFIFIAQIGGILWFMAQWRRNALQRIENERNEHEQLKNERAAYKRELEWIKNECTAQNINHVAKETIAVKEIVVKNETAERKPEIPNPSAPAPVRPAATWPFPTSKTDKPETKE